MCIIKKLLSVWCCISALACLLVGAHLDGQTGCLSAGRLKSHFKYLLRIHNSLAKPIHPKESGRKTFPLSKRRAFLQYVPWDTSQEHGTISRPKKRLWEIFAEESGHLTVSSDTKCSLVKQYGAAFSPHVVDTGLPPLINLEDSAPEDFFEDMRNFMEDPRSRTTLFWRYPLIRTFPQRTALQSLNEIMPESKVRDCINVTDGSNVDDLVDPTFQGYYSERHIKAFFRYDPEFDVVRDGAELRPRKLEMPKLKMPFDMPTTESQHERPSVPLGWRTFAVLGLYHTATGVRDPSILWSGHPLTDGDPMGRLASGLYSSANGLRVAAGSDIVKPDNTLLHSEHPIEQGELFRGRKGDLSKLLPNGPPQHERINKDLYQYRFAENGIWPRKHFEGVLSSMTLSQALWARLSTTMLRSTAKVHRLYKLRIRKNFKQEVFKARRVNSVLGGEEPEPDDPVETSVGILYFISAPTLHHAVDLVCTDPMARCNFYQQLLMFEADDALKYRIFEKREPDKENPRQYVVIGSYDDHDDPELLRDKMMRFIVRSNCVNTHLMLHAPRKDSMVDFKMPLQQFLPITEKQRDRLLDRLDNVRDACNSSNSSSPIGDLTIINQFDSDDALDWARRSPYTRSGCYKSLFVAKAYEIGFYGRNCEYISPLPMAKAMTPLRQEYAIVKRDPVTVLKKRMEEGDGHFIALPKVLPRSSELYRDLSLNQGLGMEAKVDRTPGSKGKSNQTQVPSGSLEGNSQSATPSWPHRLLITIRRTVAESFKASKVSSKYTTMKRKHVAKQIHLGAVPFRRDGSLCVDVDSPISQTPTKALRMKRISKDKFLHTMPNKTGHDCLYISNQHGQLEFPGNVQMLNNVMLSTDAIRKLLTEDAPTQLDIPFYADLLKDYIYVSLPAGDFFECSPGKDNKRFNVMEKDNETKSPIMAEEMNMLPEYKPIPYAGFWMKKSDCYLLYKDDKERFLLLGNAPERLDYRRRLSADMIKRALIQNEIILDYVRKGAALTWPDLSNAYSIRGGKMVSHLSLSEQMKTMWTVPPLNTPNMRYTLECELPAGRFYEKGADYSEEDPRYIMSHYPREVYKMTLEHLQKVDRGEARAEDDPVKIIVEADVVTPSHENISISTWEEPEVNLYKLNKSPPKEKKV
ncbi:hypothetical protein BaOVIS_005990 [Babesia ovis]|uniref:Uncharacterized protein n=1 Tax=Babesia ovis TaxID=5869 RepID=A0A9W5T993_BABOV|nr:hypothetical protein BaOVIS_005990 [Babesia ovis]